MISGVLRKKSIRIPSMFDGLLRQAVSDMKARRSGHQLMSRNKGESEADGSHRRLILKDEKCVWNKIIYGKKNLPVISKLRDQTGPTEKIISQEKSAFKENRRILKQRPLRV
jgi:hypothetical protein